MSGVLVTGGAGYIGSVVCRTLLERGHMVVVVDSLAEGHRSAVPAGVPFYRGDLGDPVLLEKIFDNHPIEGVVHLAAFCLVGESVTAPEKYFYNNVVQGLSLLRVMRTRGIRKIIFSSTAAVYGEPQGSPITEAHPTAPINPYGLSKLIFEQALETYRRAYGWQYVTFRYFNAAGAAPDCGEDHHPETHLIPLILKQALRLRGGKAEPGGEGLTVYGRDYPTPDGSCVRDYIHIKDLARAHVLALEKLDRLPVSVFNLGNGRGFSVLEVIRKAARVTGADIPYTSGPRREGDPAVLVASADRARRHLGWEPEFPDLGDIIRSAWEWHRGHPEGYNDLE